MERVTYKSANELSDPRSDMIRLDHIKRGEIEVFEQRIVRVDQRRRWINCRIGGHGRSCANRRVKFGKLTKIGGEGVRQGESGAIVRMGRFFIEERSVEGKGKGERAG